MHLGATLALLRAHSGLSLRGLAAQVGVSAAYLSRVEHGHDPAPTGERAVAIADALGLPRPLLLNLVDEARGDGTDWLRATPTGRRLASALRRRRLTEAQLARVLAIVERELPLDADERAPSRCALLHPSRVLLRVRASRLEDIWTLATMRLAEGDQAKALLDELGREAQSQTACVGAQTVLSFARAGADTPQACLVHCVSPLPLQAPDAAPPRAVWVLAGIGAGAAGADVLVRVAHLADEGLVRALQDASCGAEAITLVEQLERQGFVGRRGVQ
ncbi:helix-turn-helix domain-containing protein [Myxococcota bacterium]|nr:helix-turn-helix domain-containing protein [Myxococcota bacterium]